MDMIEPSLSGDLPAAPISPVEERQPLWSPNAILLLGALTSFYFAALLQAANMGRLNQPDRKRQIILWSTVGFIFFMVGAFLTPDNSIVNSLFLGANGGLSYWISMFHKKEFDQHITAGGGRAPMLKPVALSILGLFLLFVLVFGWAYYEVTVDEQKFETGLTYIENGKLGKAEAIFLEYAGKYPEESAAHWNLALIYHEYGELQKAKRSLLDYMALAPNDPAAAEFMAELVADLQD